MIYLFGRSRPVYESVFFLDLLAVCRARMILWEWSDTTMFELAQCLCECRSGYIREFLEECLRCLVRIDSDRTDLEDISLIHPFAHLHDRHSCLIFCVKKRCLYRRGSSIRRKDRSMDIDRHFFRYSKKLKWQDLPICYHDEVVTAIGTKYIEKF